MDEFLNLIGILGKCENFREERKKSLLIFKIGIWEWNTVKFV